MVLVGLVLAFCIAAGVHAYASMDSETCYCESGGCWAMLYNCIYCDFPDPNSCRIIGIGCQSILCGCGAGGGECDIWIEM